MKKQPQQVSQSRRKFLRDAGLSGGAAAVVASAPSMALAGQPEGSDEAAEDPKGYRLTDHILAYYKSAAD